VHFTTDADPGFRCAAFPDGIPDEILHSKFDHRNPHPGDNGIQYERVKLPKTKPAERQPGRDLLIHKSWLQSRLTEAQVWSELGEGDWAKLKAKFQPGDQLYYFESPRQFWENQTGRAGVALVRDDRVIELVILVMN
jgi:hypothetical protein